VAEASSQPFRIAVVDTSNIVFDGSYETGDYLQWALPTVPTHPQFAPIPWYGRPVYPPDGATRYPGVDPSYFGNGDLMELVTSVEGGPVRSGSYANRITVKSTAGGSIEAPGGDPPPDGGDWDNSVSTRRRTELNAHLRVGDDGVTMPYLSTRWYSISIFVPSDWEDSGNTEWFSVMQLKGPTVNSHSPTLALSLQYSGAGNNFGGYSWNVIHRWNPNPNPTNADYPGATYWPWTMFYTNLYPTPTDWPDGMADFPEAGSQAALSLVKGVWTDFIFKITFDGRGSLQGGTGELEMWKRDGDGPWVHVLHLLPRIMSRGTFDDPNLLNQVGGQFDRGVTFVLEPTSGIVSPGYGPLAGMYLDNAQVLGLAGNRTLYNDNIKVATPLATDQQSFASISPDGSTPWD
jgi:hypothetical protein